MTQYEVTFTGNDGFSVPVTIKADQMAHVLRIVIEKLHYVQKLTIEKIIKIEIEEVEVPR